MSEIMSFQPDRRNVLTLIGGAAVLGLVSTSPPLGGHPGPAVTVTKIAADRPLDALAARRSTPGLLSQRILRNQHALLVIEEWRHRPEPHSSGYVRLEI